MKNTNTKTKVAIFALILMLTTTSIAILTTVSAQDNVSDWKTHLYLVPQPSSGVGQEMFIVYWIDHMPRPETDEEIAAGIRGAYTDITLTIKA